MKLAIVGMGRLGRSISAILDEKKHPHHCVHRNTPVPDAEVFYLTVPDRELLNASKRIPKNKIILHASGVYDHQILRPRKHIGALHPIMSFPGPEVSLPPPPIPASVVGDPDAIDAAEWLAGLIGFNTFHFSGDRSLYHAAAVIAGNFSTTLLHLAAHTLKTKEMPLDEAIAHLTPLAIQSIKQAPKGTLKQTLTGPLSRMDHETIKRHLNSLRNQEQHIAEAYENLCNATLQHLDLEQRNSKKFE